MWLKDYHADGIRVDGVSSMLYLNFGIDDPSQKRFGVMVLALFGAIAVVTIGTAAFVEFIGIPLNGFLYGVDFEQYRGLARIMVATGGLCAAIDNTSSTTNT